MSATYAIYTSPNHKPIPDHLPTLIITPHGKPHQVLYTYLHTNYNKENYLLTPSDQGDLCVAKLFPPPHLISNQTTGSGSDRQAIRCEASRNLKWTIRNEGIQNPVYKLTLPNPDNPQIEQPLFQVSKPNPNCPWWTLFYFTYAGHLIPPKRIEFGKIIKSSSNDSRGGSNETKISVTGKTEEEKAVWKTLGQGNEDMVEWIIICASLNVLDDEIAKAVEAAGVKLASGPNGVSTSIPTQSSGPARQLHPTGSARPPATAPIRPAVYNAPQSRSHRPPPPNNSGPPRQLPPSQHNRSNGPMPVSRGSSTSSHSHSHDSHRRVTSPTSHLPSVALQSTHSQRSTPHGSRPMPTGIPASSRGPPTASQHHHAPPLSHHHQIPPSPLRQPPQSSNHHHHQIPPSPHRQPTQSSNHHHQIPPSPHRQPPQSSNHHQYIVPNNSNQSNSRPGLRAMAQTTPPSNDHRIRKVK